MASELRLIHRRTCLRIRGFIVCLCVLVTWPTVVRSDEPQKPRTLIVFSALGDIPYTPEEYQLLKQQLAELPKESEFVVHVGDIKPGKDPCIESTYQDVAAILEKSPCPLLIIPGDNEWNDCTNPDEAWPLWTKHLNRFEEKWKHTLDVKRQEKRDENFAFVRSDVLFIGINIVGGRVHDAKEWGAAPRRKSGMDAMEH